MLALNQTLTAEQRLQKAVMAIMAHDKYVGLSSVLMIGDRTVDDTVPTACTNGRDEMYGRGVCRWTQRCRVAIPDTARVLPQDVPALDYVETSL